MTTTTAVDASKVTRTGRGLGIPGVIPWDGPLQIHVGVDAWNMTPVNLTEIEHLIAGDTE